MDIPIASIKDCIIDLRHRLHRIPELGYEEHKTAAILRAQLDQWGISWIKGPSTAPTATIAVIGDPSKSCIAFRADIDALPIQEKTGLPYSSTHPGLMHACGHDGHSATLMGLAGMLHGMRDKLPVCVKLIWQPAEEGGAGAARLVEAGVLDGRLGPKVEAIFGLHGWPGLKVGTVATKAGALLAATDNFTVTFTAPGCHGAFPHLSGDPILAAAEAISNLQQVISREIDPTEPAVLTVGIVRGGTAVNIIPDSASFEGTVRSLSDAARVKLQEAIRRRCQAIAKAGGCELKFEWFPGYPATVNDPAMADYVASVAKSALGPDHYLPVARPAMGGEDFAYYLQNVKGCFFMIGVEPHNQTTYPSLHSDHYDFTDAALETGVRMFIGIVTNWHS